MITRVAINVGGVLYTGDKGERHHHLLNDKSRPFGFLKSGEQGFVDEEGHFYTRSEAAMHAFACKQIPMPHAKLFSEDLW